MNKVMDVQLDMVAKGFHNLRKVLKKDLEGGINMIMLVATSPSGEDRQVRSHSVFGLLDYPVTINRGDIVIPMED